MFITSDRSRERYIDINGGILELITDYKGDKYYYNNDNLFHRLSGPAIQYDVNSYSYEVHGKFHRIGGPACFDSKENLLFWYINGKKVNVYYVCG